MCFFSVLDLVKVTLLNGDGQECTGKEIDVAVYGKSQEGTKEVCYSQRKTQISSGKIVWSTQDLGGKCKKAIFDPDKKIEVQVRTHAYIDPFCPKKVELEILDIKSNIPRYFCCKMNDFNYKNSDNWRKHVAKEERCFSS